MTFGEPESGIDMSHDREQHQRNDRPKTPSKATAPGAGRLRKGVQTEGGYAALKDFLERPLTRPIRS